MWNAVDPWLVNSILKAFVRITNVPLVPTQIWMDEETFNDIKAFADEDMER